METIELIIYGLILIVFLYMLIRSIKLFSKFKFAKENVIVSEKNIESYGFQQDAVKFVRIKIKENNYDNPSIDEYFTSLSSVITQAKTSIKVVEYLPSNNVIRGLFLSKKGNLVNDFADKNAKGLLKKYKEYYAHLRGYVRDNKDIEYTRVLQISGWFRDKEEGTRDKLINTTMELLPPALIEHIGAMFNSNCEDKFSLYILSEPVVVYNYLIADKKMVASEYFRYNKEGINFPDEMYINVLGDSSPYEGSQLEKRTKLFDEIIKKNEPISKAEFIEAVSKRKIIENNEKEYAKEKEMALERV